MSEEIKTSLERIESLVRNLQAPPEIVPYPKGVGKLLHCGRSTLDRMKDEGLFPVYRLRGKLYCKLSEIIAAVEAGKVEVHEKEHL